MKTSIFHKLALYLYNHFLGNFLGFIVGMASTKLVSHFFATKSIRNLWGLTSKKTLIDKQTFTVLEVTVSIVIGFIVFEIISKVAKKKLDEMLPVWKVIVKNLLQRNRRTDTATTLSYSGSDAATTDTRSKRVWRDVQ